MTHYSPSAAIVAAANVTAIKLTSYGRVVVSVYPADAIKNADAELKRMSSVKNPMAFFLSACKKYCERTGSKPNYDLLNDFKSKNPEWVSLPEYDRTAPTEPSIASKTKYSKELPFDYVDPYKDKVQEDRINDGVDYDAEYLKFIGILQDMVARGERLNPYAHQVLVDTYLAKQGTAPVTVLRQEAASVIAGPALEIPTNEVPAAPVGRSQSPVVRHEQIRATTNDSLSGNTVTPLPTQSFKPEPSLSSPDVYVELDPVDVGLIATVIGLSGKLGPQKEWVLKAIKEVMDRGANHSAIKDGTFRSGMEYIVTLFPPYEDEGIDYQYPL